MAHGKSESEKNKNTSKSKKQEHSKSHHGTHGKTKTEPETKMETKTEEVKSNPKPLPMIPPINNYTINLLSLTADEEAILEKVLEKDEEETRELDERVGILQREIVLLRKQAMWKPDERDPTDMRRKCIRCRRCFGYWRYAIPLIDRGMRCQRCLFRVCNSCRHRQANGLWLCTLCVRFREIQLLTGNWAHLDCNKLSGTELLRISFKDKEYYLFKKQLLQSKRAERGISSGVKVVDRKPVGKGAKRGKVKHARAKKGKHSKKKGKKKKNKSKNANDGDTNANVSHAGEEEIAKVITNDEVCVNDTKNLDSQSDITAHEFVTEQVPTSHNRGRRLSHTQNRSSGKRKRSSEQHLRWQDERKENPLRRKVDFGARGDSDLGCASNEPLLPDKVTNCKYSDNAGHSAFIALTTMSGGDYQQETSDKQANKITKGQRMKTGKHHHSKTRKRVRHSFGVDYMLNENKDARNLKYYGRKMSDNKHSLTKHSSSVQALPHKTQVSLSERPSGDVATKTLYLGLTKQTLGISAETIFKIDNSKNIEAIDTLNSQQRVIKCAPVVELINGEYKCNSHEIFNSKPEEQTECCMVVRANNYADVSLVDNDKLHRIQQSGEPFNLMEKCQETIDEVHFESSDEKKIVVPFPVRSLTDETLTVPNDVLGEQRQASALLAEAREVNSSPVAKKSCTSFRNSTVVQRMKYIVTNIVDNNSSSVSGIKKAAKNDRNENYKMNRMAVSQHPGSQHSLLPNRGSSFLDPSTTEKGRSDKARQDKEKRRGSADKGKSGKGKPNKGKPDKGKSDKGKSDKGRPNKGKPEKGKSVKGAIDKKKDKGRPDKVKFSTDKDKPTSDKGKGSGSLTSEKHAGKSKLDKKKVQMPNTALKDINIGDVMLKSLTEAKMRSLEQEKQKRLEISIHRGSQTDPRSRFASLFCPFCRFSVEYGYQ